MTSYHGASICKNGHVVSKYNANSQRHCSKCGAEVVSLCSHCNQPIRGLFVSDIVIVGNRPYTRPDYCYNCGKPYPWTESALQSTALLLQEEEELSEQLKESLVESLPDIITETPATNLAVVRVKKCFASAGKFTVDAVRQFVIDFGCELAKKSLGF